MVSFFGDYDTTETVNIPFNTFSSDDPSASITIVGLVAADVEIHKDGGLTQRASDNGVTVDTDFDAAVGPHMVSIDLSDNSDVGFYSAGSRYQVRLTGVTVDGATIEAWIGAFSIGCTLRPTVNGRTIDIAATGEAGVDFANINGTLGNANVSWVDGNNRVDLGQFLGNAVTVTGGRPHVHTQTISDIDAPATWRASLLSQANQALLNNHLDHLLAANYDPAAKPGVATALLNELVENDGGVARFTANALEQAPAGGGGSADWTTGEREQIRSALGIDGTKTAATGGQLQTLDAVADAIRVVTDTFTFTGGDVRATLDGETVSVGDKTGFTLSSAGNDAVAAATFAATVEGSRSLVEMIRGIGAATMGISSGHESGTPVYRDTNDTINRIQATTDANGNRTATTLNLS